MLVQGEKAIITRNKSRIGIIRRDRGNVYTIALDNGIVASITGYAEAIAWERNEG